MHIILIERLIMPLNLSTWKDTLNFIELIDFTSMPISIKILRVEYPSLKDN